MLVSVWMQAQSTDKAEREEAFWYLLDLNLFVHYPETPGSKPTMSLQSARFWLDRGILSGHEGVSPTDRFSFSIRAAYRMPPGNSYVSTSLSCDEIPEKYRPGLVCAYSYRGCVNYDDEDISAYLKNVWVVVLDEKREKEECLVM
ncbi:Hypothetical protein POVN_LOCUS113 [uncultured virus]|nr:Hypothetical protein POVN_LOCUS113 [uncultured virus]